MIASSTVLVTNSLTLLREPRGITIHYYSACLLPQPFLSMIVSRGFIPSRPRKSHRELMRVGWALRLGVIPLMTFRKLDTAFYTYLLAGILRFLPQFPHLVDIVAPDLSHFIFSGYGIGIAGR